MANVKLSEKSVGDIVKMNVSGEATEFLVVHQGNPGNMYDKSCDGTWLLMKDIYKNCKWAGGIYTSYDNSTIYSELANMVSLFDEEIQGRIKEVKIPYCTIHEHLHTMTVKSGADGVTCKLFALAYDEVGFPNSSPSVAPSDGTRLDYFEAGSGEAANQKRIANYNREAANWWLRTPEWNPSTKEDSAERPVVSSIGGQHSYNLVSGYEQGIRPALILPNDLWVTDDDFVTTNTPPTTPGSITVPESVRGGSSVTVQWAASTDVDENLSGYELERKHDSGQWEQVYKGDAQTHDDAVEKGWATVQYRVRAYDKSEAYSDYATSEIRTVINIPSASVTLKEPMTVAEPITLAVLSVSGSIPDDAELKVEVTNNAKDGSPAWQDATAAVKAGKNIVFENQTAESGPAFNFKVSVKRGVSGQGGHITSIQGGFQ